MKKTVAKTVPAQAASNADNSAGTQKNDDSKKTPDTQPKPDPEAAKKAAEAAKKAAEEQQKQQLEQQMLAKIKQLKFDRRPSVVLKTWSTPFKTLAQIAEEKKKEAEKNGAAAKPVQVPASALPPGGIPANGAAPNAAGPSNAADPANVAANQTAEALKQFDEDLHRLKFDVTLSDWGRVSEFVSSLESKIQEALYQQLLTSLQNPPRSVPSNMIAYAEKNQFSLDDILALIRLTPKPLNKTTVLKLGSLVRVSLSAGNSLDDLVKKLKDLSNEPLPPDTKPESIRFDKRRLAELLMSAGQTLRAGEFLPTADEAIDAVDRDSLNLLARYFLAQHAKKKETELLEKAWRVTQSALSAGEITDAQKQEALKRAVELAPKIEQELGQTWLDESFTTRPDRGMEILATIGSAVSTGLVQKSSDPARRLKELELQNTAVQALLKAAPDQAKDWAATLNLLAANWLREAEHSRVYDQSSSRGPTLTRDVYGNFFYSSFSYNRYSGSSNRTPQAIASGKLLDIKPNALWLEHINGPMQPKYVTILPQLHLKVNEEDKAFPYIESLAESNPEIAKQLAEEFLRVWTKKNDPNSNTRRTNIYMFSYGFNRRAQGIPLTRSKQVRNMKELSEWVARIRRLPIEDIDQSILTNAFTNTHGSAEVYKLKDIEAVFGSLDKLKPKALATLIQKMRSNLSTVWRMPATQKQAGTNRKKKDIEIEVRRGYRVANTVLAEALKAHPDSWELHLAKAAINHDETNYQHELEQSSEFTKHRSAALAAFKECADRYAKAVVDLKEDDYSAQVFEMWFYASLGDCDLGKIKKDKAADLKQMPLIKAAIDALPGESAEKHMAMFANSLFTRLSAVNPGVKFRFLRAGFDIVGDHKRADEARKVFQYYKDLVTEIKLEAVVDGSADVGHGEPFGLFVNLRHTSAIERESGGFSRYLQNQNQNSYFSFNYGRPTENYRDKFEEFVATALSEQFEVQSVTFQREDVNSRATEQEGWRVTPYAYILLKAKGPEVDKIPSIQLDLDFMDTSGYAVIPVETPEVPINASGKSGDSRPLKQLAITQTLDERQAKDGKLILEVKAAAQGLVPKLDDILDVRPEQFDIVDVQDEGVSVTQFDKEAEENVIVSERNWLVTLQAKEELKDHPKSFEFAKPMLDTKEVAYQRYVDADLASVESTISLEHQYGEPQAAWIMWTVGAVVLIIVIIGSYFLINTKTAETPDSRFVVPAHVTAFTVLGLLKNIEGNNGLTSTSASELSTTINRVERYFFFDEGEEPDLESIASEWVQRAR